MRKVTCKDCNGRGHITINDIIEPCQSCYANGYLIYIEEGDAYGADCKRGECE